MRTRPVDGKLTFVVPVTLDERCRMDAGLAWRRDPDYGVVVRLRMLLASLIAMCRDEDLQEVIVIVREDERDEVAALVRSQTRDPRFVVVCEEAVCEDVLHARDPASGIMRGWYAQQILKLAAAGRVTTPFYVTLDSDIVCMRPFAYDSLVHDGRALCNVETMETYTALYTPEFARRERSTKQRRLDASASLLGGPRPARYEGRYYGETPVVLHADSVQSMCEALEANQGRPWAHVLGETDGWTEYTLYFQYLEARGELESVHEPTGPDHVLDLRKSAWHVPDRYLESRTYDRDHFVGDLRLREDGFFVALQSYLGPEDWLLSSGSHSMDQFYARLAHWLGVPGVGDVSVARRLQRFARRMMANILKRQT